MLLLGSPVTTYAVLVMKSPASTTSSTISQSTCWHCLRPDYNQTFQMLFWATPRLKDTVFYTNTVLEQPAVHLAMGSRLSIKSKDSLIVNRHPLSSSLLSSTFELQQSPHRWLSRSCTSTGYHKRPSLDSNLTFSNHVSNICRSAHYHIHDRGTALY